MRTKMKHIPSFNECTVRGARAAGDVAVLRPGLFPVLRRRRRGRRLLVPLGRTADRHRDRRGLLLRRARAGDIASRHDRFKYYRGRWRWRLVVDEACVSPLPGGEMDL